mmetsp:Transcript_7156/g.21869  ORF Transcript_7156/g.21869 Transcript_7156/m.21869 type:complete len:443 (-) Transcript_7156:205-1533(-)
MRQGLGHPIRASASLLLACAGAALALEDGLARKPPMGWRSWNLYGAGINQTLMEKIMDGMVSRQRLVDGVPTSLCDLGYCNVGLDDNWQACGSGTDFFHYHTRKNGKFHPMVNMERFPDMAGMNAHAHRLGLTTGWYGNNCICRELRPASEALYRGDVEALVAFGFDAIKLDGCGTQYDLGLWQRLLNGTGRPITIENCHWGRTVPKHDWCPWHVFRTSGDVRASYGSVVGNLLTTVPWAARGLSRPGCWAYPDGLEVGCRHGPGGARDPGLSPAEARTHFGAWCIVSSPLVLSLDVNDDELMDEVWPLISNQEAIAVNQAWAGRSGGPFLQAAGEVRLKDFQHVVQGVSVPHASAVPSWQYFRKPLNDWKVAVLLMNHDSHRQHVSLSFADVPESPCTRCDVRDIWAHEDLGEMSDLSVELDSHDSAFFVLSKVAAPSVVV